MPSVLQENRPDGPVPSSLSFQMHHPLCYALRIYSGGPASYSAWLFLPPSTSSFPLFPMLWKSCTTTIALVTGPHVQLASGSTYLNSSTAPCFTRHCTCTPVRDNLRGSLIHEDSVHKYPSCKWLMTLTAHSSAVVQSVTAFSRFVLEKRQSRCGRCGAATCG